MSREAVDKIVKSLLYEGYMLYPYRRSALKNQHRWNCGLVYPEGMESDHMITECLIAGGCGAEAAAVEVRFLQLSECDSWEETRERRILTRKSGANVFDFGSVRGETLVHHQRIDFDVYKIRVEIVNKTRLDPCVKDPLQCLISTH